MELLVHVVNIENWNNLHHTHSPVGRLPSSLPGSGLTALSVGSPQPASPISCDGQSQACTRVRECCAQYSPPPQASVPEFHSLLSSLLLISLFHVWENALQTAGHCTKLNGRLEARTSGLSLEIIGHHSSRLHEVNN